jgi:homocysteine S-methyltransferase
MNDPLTEILEHQGVVILDGGLATELETRGHDLTDELWSARLIVEAPESIQQLHFDYLDAGADCIVSASYQASVSGFQRKGLSEKQAVRMLRRSVELALAARDAFWAAPPNRGNRHRPLVAASVGPYGAFLADGSEYTGAYELDAAGLVDFHRQRLEILAASDADLLAFETIPSAAEARVLVGLLESIPDRSAWMSFSCRDGAHISDGTKIAAIAAEISDSSQVAAVGVNCTAPRYINSLIAAIREATAVPIVVYPNSGDCYDAETKQWLPGGSRLDLVQASAAWVERGARIIGGCCRTGPGDIRRLRRRLHSSA